MCVCVYMCVSMCETVCVSVDVCVCGCECVCVCAGQKSTLDLVPQEPSVLLFVQGHTGTRGLLKGWACWGECPGDHVSLHPSANRASM